MTGTNETTGGGKGNSGSRAGQRGGAGGEAKDVEVTRAAGTRRPERAGDAGKERASTGRSWLESTPLATVRREFGDLIEGLMDREKLFGEWATMPRVDVVETDKTIEVITDVPGFKSDEVDVELRSNCVIISGEHEEEQEESKGDRRRYHRVERRRGRFSRSVQLPCAVKESEVHAELREGVLTVVLPKTEESQSRRIPIRS